MGTTLTKPDPPSDLLLNEFSPQYNREYVALVNPSGSTSEVLTSALGQPVKDNAGTWEFVEAADIANAEGVVIDALSVPAILAAGTSPAKYGVLRRGPAVVRTGKLAATDILGAAITSADFVTALAAVGIVCRAEPAEQSTQTT